MPTPEAIQSAYIRALASTFGPGETVIIRRIVAGVNTDYPAHAWVTTLSVSDIAGEVQQGKRKAIVLYNDLVLAGFPFPLIPKKDRLIRQGGSLNSAIMAIDDETRRTQGVTYALELEIDGA